MYYKDFVDFPKLNWSYILLRYMLQLTFHMVYKTKYKSKVHTYRYQTDLFESVTPCRGHKIKSISKQALRVAQ